MPRYNASYSEDNPRFVVAKMLLFLVPGITRDSQDNSFQTPGIKLRKHLQLFSDVDF